MTTPRDWRLEGAPRRPLWLRALTWAGWALLALVLAVVLFLAFFDLNRLRGPIAEWASARLGRTVAIRGPLAVDWSWTPRFTVGGVELADAAWSKRREMFTLKRAEVSLSLPELFKGHLVLPDILIDQPRLNLERDAKGRANWDLGLAAPSAPPDPRWVPRLGRVRLTGGHLLFQDAAEDAELDLDLAATAGGAGEQAMTVDGTGRMRRERFTLAARGGSPLALKAKGKPFPVQLEVAYGPTGAKVEGSFDDPLRLAGPDLRFEAHGPDLAALRPFTQLWIPKTPPYRFSGQVNRRGERWLVRDFAGQLGGSDLAGDMSFMMRQGRPFLDGDLVSGKLDFKDLAGFIGADPRPTAPPRPRLLPDEPYDVAGLRVADADIRFRSSHIVTPKMPVDAVLARVQMERGVVEVDPAEATLGFGKVASKIRLDARAAKIKAEVSAKVDKVPFRRLLAGTRFEAQSGGLIMGKADIDTVGNSVAEMAAASDGGVTLVMERGRISELIMEAAGLDIAEIVGIVATGRDRAMPVDCLVGDFILSDGVAKAKLLLLDTADTRLQGAGQVDLHDEALDLRFVAHPKDPSVFSARTPLRIEGTLKQPKPRPEVLPLAARAAASVALGAALTPAAAVLPWIELGLGQDSPCRNLVNAAEKAGGVAKPGKGRR